MKRTLIFTTAAILMLAIAFYLGGALSGILLNYQEWLADDGMLGCIAMKSPDMNPAVCFSRAFTAHGILCSLIISGALAGLSVIWRMQNRSGKYDERNFKPSRTGTYGTAGWMSKQEMRTVLEEDTPEKVSGTILGWKNGRVLALPVGTMLNKHLFICGATGTMKSRAVIRNQLFQRIRRGESVIVTDAKTELYADTSDLFRDNGYTVKVFNLVDLSNGDSWNCMADLGGDTLMAQMLVDVIIANTKDDNGGDHFWNSTEGNLLKALVLYVDHDISRQPCDKHLPAVYQLLTRYTEQQLTAMFDRLPLDHPAKAPFNLFRQASDTVRTGTIIGLGTRLQVLQNELVCDVICRAEIDLSLPAKTKCAYFIILSDQDGSLNFLSSLFFSFLFQRLVRYADAQPNGCCDIPVNLILDEFNNIGIIPDFSRKLSTIRSRAIQVSMAVQGLPQLQNRYPQNVWAEIVGNCDTQLMLGCVDATTAEFYSLRSGDMTLDVDTKQTQRKSIAITQFIPMYRLSEGLGKRRLLTPDEVLRLPNDELLIVIRGQKILKAKKFDYIKHPFAGRLKRTPISDYKLDDGPLPHSDTIRSIPQTDPSAPISPPGLTPQESAVKSAPSNKLITSAKPPEEF